MIEGDPPYALSVFREGCERYDAGDVETALSLLRQARILAEGLGGDAFAKFLVDQIDQRLAGH